MKRVLLISLFIIITSILIAVFLFNELFLFRNPYVVYETKEGCGNNICDLDEDCDSCPNDCSCDSSSDSGGESSKTRNSEIIQENINFQTYSINNEELLQGYILDITKEDIIKLQIKEEIYYIMLEKINTKTIDVITSPNPIRFTLNIKETKKLDLNDDINYDLEISLNSIKDKFASIHIIKINEQINDESIGEISKINETTKESNKGFFRTVGNVITEIPLNEGNGISWVRIFIAVISVAGLILISKKIFYKLNNM